MKELELLEAKFETVKKSVSDDLEFVNFEIETEDGLFDYQINLHSFLCGMERYKVIDSFSDDLQKVTIELPDVKGYQSAKDEVAGGVITEDAIDVINDNLAEYGTMILKWFLRQESKRKVF